MIRFLKITVILLSLGLFVWIAGFVCFSAALDRQALTPLPDQKTDAIIVLTGGPDRVNTGIDLLEQKKSGQLFISGVHDSVTLNDLIALWRPEAPVVLVPCCITLGHKARNTTQNAEESALWVSRNNVRSLRLLTAAYHMPRARLEFEAALPDDVTIVPHPLITMAPAETKQAYRQLVFSEYNKTILTWLRTKLKKTKS
ncbi:MAG: YdcF family protein [Rhodospirillales bacterium]|nr:YdcF family protein [Rhodospirillales bacterium]